MIAWLEWHCYPNLPTLFLDFWCPSLFLVLLEFPGQRGGWSKVYLLKLAEMACSTVPAVFLDGWSPRTKPSQQSSATLKMCPSGGVISCLIRTCKHYEPQLLPWRVTGLTVSSFRSSTCSDLVWPMIADAVVFCFELVMFMSPNLLLLLLGGHLLPWQRPKECSKKGTAGESCQGIKCGKRGCGGCRLERVPEALRMGDDSKTNLTRNFSACHGKRQLTGIAITLSALLLHVLWNA